MECTLTQPKLSGTIATITRLEETRRGIATADQTTSPPSTGPEAAAPEQPQPDDSNADRVYPSASQLLKLAREEVDKGKKGNLRFALECLERYRDEVLRNDQPRRVFDTLPILRSIQGVYEAPSSVKDDARQFVQNITTWLEPWPDIAQEYEQRVLQEQLDEIEERRRSVMFKLLPWVGVAFSLAGLVLLILSGVRDDISAGESLGGALALPAGLLFAGIAVVLQRAHADRLSAEAENVRRKLNLRAVRTSATAGTLPTATSDGTARTDITGTTRTETPGGEYFGTLVRINVDNLSDYYYQVRVHTNNSFWASIAAGALGFLLIAAGLGLGFFQASDASTRSLSYLATASGVIVEFISGVFFYLYNRTVRQLKDYHDSLLDVQNILLSFRIVEQSEADRQGALFDQILRFLLQQRGQDADVLSRPAAL
jgi:hypothetical protein